MAWLTAATPAHAWALDPGHPLARPARVTCASGAARPLPAAAFWSPRGPPDGPAGAGVAPAPWRPCPPGASPFAVDWARDWSLTAGMLAVSLVLEAAVTPTLGGAPGCRAPADGRTACAPGALWRLDRAVLRHDHRGWRQASDVLQPAALLLGAAATAALAAWDANHLAPGRAALTDLTVTTQAVAAATFASTALKYAVRRPRPTAYRHAAAGAAGSLLSFPSGHTAAVAAAGTAWAMHLRLRRPRPAATAWAFGAAAAVTAGVAAGRVLGGRHFLSDVVAGAALGAACGVAVPLAHRLAVGPAPAGVALAVRF